ncbi:MAG: purine-nucleoside phosphorylase [Bryobacteraceae bacterium]
MIHAVRFVRSRSDLVPRVGVVLGSGLSSLANSLRRAVAIKYREIPGFPESTAEGHQGELLLGYLGDMPVAVMSGRFHLYEGYSPAQVVMGVQLLHQLGVKQLVLTNAAGAVNPAFVPGSLVLISDHINLQGFNPLVGPNDESLGPRFPDMTEAYSKRLRQVAMQAAHDVQIPIFEGVYAALLGPSYETPAEIRFLRTIGADLVGMSTVSETIAANYLGVEVLGISCVTNLAAGLSENKLNHQEVLELGRRVSGSFVQLLQAILPKL